MEPGDERLQPEQIDAQIEWLIQSWPEEPPSNNQNARLAKHLQHHYAKEKQEQILQRAWQSIAQRYEDGLLAFPAKESAQDEQRETKRIGQYHMQQIADRQVVKKPYPRWGIFLAVAVLALMVGSTAVIISQATQHKGPGTGSGGGGVYSSCTSTPTQIVPTPTPVPSQGTPTQVVPTPTPVPSQGTPAQGQSTTSSAKTVGSLGTKKHPTCTPIPTPTQAPTGTPEQGTPTPTPTPTGTPGWEIPTPTPTSVPPTPTPGH